MKKLSLSDLDNRYILLAVLSSIIILSILLRIYKLGSESLTLDEMATVNVAKKSIEEIILYRNIHPPFYYIIIHYWIELFGDSEFSIRFPSVIFGVISVYIIYKLGKLIFDEKVGILSAFILSISIFHILYSQTARFYSLLALLVLLSNYYFIKILEEPSQKNTIRQKNTVKYIISTLLMIYTHGYGLLYIIVQNIYYLLFKKNIRYWFMVQGIILIFFIPWINIMIKRLETVGVGGGGLSWINRPTLFSLYDLFKFFADTNEIGIYIFIFVCIADLFIFQKNEQTNRIENSNKNSNESSNTFKPRRIFLFLWLLFPIITSFIISIIFAPIYLNRYVIGSLPAFVLIISKGIFNFRKYSIAAIPIILMVLILPTISTTELYYSVLDQEQWRDVANYIDANKRNDEIILLYIVNVKVPFGYYFKNGTNVPLWDVIYHNGSRSVKINVPGTTNGKSGNIRSIPIDVEKNQNYTFSAWAKVQDIGGKNAPALRVVELDKAGKMLKTNNLIFDYKDDGWIQKNKTFQTNISTSRLYISANIYDGYGTFWIDDISLITYKDPQNKNLIPNPSFEIGTNRPIGWNFTEKDLYFGISDSKNIESLIKDNKGVWLIISHASSSEMRNESKLIREILSKKYTNQSKAKFVGMELIYYRE